MSIGAERRVSWRGYGASPRSRLMFWLFAAIVAVLLVALGNALTREAARMEAVALHTTLNQIRGQLVLVYAEAMLKREPLNGVGMNPLQYFEVPPMEYRGEMTATEAGSGSGFWYFDSQAQVLVYRARFIEVQDEFQADTEGVFRIRVEEEYRDEDGDGRRGPEERLQGLRLGSANETNHRPFGRSIQ